MYIKMTKGKCLSAKGISDHLPLTTTWQLTTQLKHRLVTVKSFGEQTAEATIAASDEHMLVAVVSNAHAWQSPRQQIVDDKRCHHYQNQQHLKWLKKIKKLKGLSSDEQSSGSSCVKVEVAVRGSPSLIVLMVSVDVKQHWKSFCEWVSQRQYWHDFIPESVFSAVWLSCLV